MALRLIHVGLGGWGRDWEANALPGVTDVERVAIVDSDTATLDRAQAQLGLPDTDCFSDFGTALDEVDADAVLVTAPLAAHAPLAVQGLEAGRHVLVEKPFAPTVAEAREVVDCADKAGRTLMVSQNYRFHPAARSAARLVADQYVGALGHVRVDFRKWSNTAPAGTGRHYKLAHPLLYDMAIHHFDLMRMILQQEPIQVSAHVTDPSWSRFQHAASATLVLTFDGGTIVSYRGSWVSPGTPTTWSGDWHLEGEKGEIYWTGRAGGDAAGDSEILTVRRLPAAGGTDEAETLDPVGMAGLRHVGRAGAVAEFARAIAAGDEPETSGRRNLASLAISEAAARSIESGRAEPVTTV